MRYALILIFAPPVLWLIGMVLAELLDCSVGAGAFHACRVAASFTDYVNLLVYSVFLSIFCFPLGVMLILTRKK